MELRGARIGAADLSAAIRAYRRLLDVPAVTLDGGGVRFLLGRGLIEVVPGPADLRALCVADAEAPGPAAVHGVALASDPAYAGPPAGPAAVAIDHIVVQTADPERAIAAWRDGLGVRLALDRAFPARGLRLLFFRSGGLTLEYAAPLGAGALPAGDDRLHGIGYRVTDLAARRDRLLAAGVDVSPLRPGMRPGTTVATVRGGTAGVPTLLLQLDPPAQ